MEKRDMNERDDKSLPPVVTVSGTAAADEHSPHSVTTNLPAATWPPKTLGDFMTRKIITVGEEEAVGDLEGWMKRFRFHHLPVVGADGKLVGLITQTDYLHAKLGAAPDGRVLSTVLPDTKASAIMRKDVVVGHMEDALAVACDVMLREKLGCLPVVLDDTTLVGIVTNTDFVRLAQELLKSR
jgi:CBS domain-containing protein